MTYMKPLKEVCRLAEQAGLQVEICEKRKGMRLHAVMRKAGGERG